MSFAFMPVYTGDYQRDTKHLTPEEHGVYFLLLTHCWDQKGPVPLDERRQCGIVNARSGGEIESLRRVLTEFFVRMDDGWYNQRMSEEVAKAEQISAGRRKGGLEKARRMRDAVRHAQAMLKQNKSTTQAMVQRVPSPPPSPLQPHPPQACQDLPLSEISKTEGEKPLRASRAALSAPPDVSEQVWTDFLQTRKTLKAAVTATAVAGIAREAAKAGMSLEDALRMCCARGWRGFKAEWVAGQNGAQKSGSEGQAERVAKLFFGDRAKEVLNGRE